MEDSNGCTREETIVIIATSTDDIDFDSDIKIYPNPSGGFLNIVTNEFKENIQVRILSLTGKYIEEYQVRGKGSINLGHLTNGTYFIELSTDKWKYVQRQVILN